MKKPRLHRWRWLLALLLGAGAWWGVGWWLSPKPYLTLERSSIPGKELDELHQKKDEPEIDVPGERNFIIHRASILDTTGRYLLLEEIFGPRRRCYEVIDLQTRQVLARHVFAELEQVFEPDEVTEYRSNPLGIKHVIRYGWDPADRFEEVEDGRIVLGRPSARQLWEWNVLKNEHRMLRKYSRNTNLKISQDGSTLLEIERVTPLMPALLAPLRLTHVLAGLAINAIGGNDLAFMHVRSLPSLEKRFKLAIPWIERQCAAELSHDGRYLIIPDANTASGFTSPSQYSTKRYLGFAQGGRGFVTTGEYYASQPLGIRVYDTQSNQLWWKYRSLQAIYCHGTLGNTLLHFKSERESGDLGPPELLLHLPSRTVLRPLASNSMAPLSETTIQFDSINIKEDDVTQEIQAIDQDGQTHTLATINAQGLQLIPHATQYLLEAEQSPRLLDMLAGWLHARQWFTDWQPKVTWEIKMVDYWKQRTLWAERFQHRPVATIAYPWLLVSHNDGERFHLSVYALPFSSWSPWWARIAGLIVCLFVHYLVRQRRTKANDVPSLPKNAY